MGKLTIEKFHELDKKHMTSREMAKHLKMPLKDFYDDLACLSRGAGSGMLQIKHKVGISDKSWKIVGGKWVNARYKINRNCYFRCVNEER